MGIVLTTHTGSVRTLTIYPGRDAVLQHTRVGVQFNDIPGSGMVHRIRIRHWFGMILGQITPGQ